MSIERKYKPTDKMSDLICDNFSLLTVMSRFGLTLGFGDKTVEEVCESQQVDCPTFLAVANFMNEGMVTYNGESDDFSIVALMNYLKSAHTYFLDFCLPMIRAKLIEALDFSSEGNVALLILRFFDDLTKVVRKHMEYENNAVFTYVEDLLQKRPTGTHTIKKLNSKHDQIDTKLRELKNIIIKYYPNNSNNNLLNSVLFDIFCCEQDLDMHCHIEDFLFTPAIARLERRVQHA